MNPLSEDRQLDHSHIQPTKVLDTKWINQFETQDSPSTYITKKMIDALKDTLLLKRWTLGLVKSDNLHRLQKRLRKGSWAARCLEWDGVYRAKKTGTMRIMRVKRLNLPGD